MYVKSIEEFRLNKMDNCGTETLECFFTDQYWDGNGPIFFYTGNEGPITGFWDNSGFVFEAAEEFNALVIFGEHVSINRTLLFYVNGIVSCLKVHFGTYVVVLEPKVANL